MTDACDPASTDPFYDGLAADYHLIYGDRWDEAVERQGRALDRLIDGLAPGARTVLDCSCGIGTQAIGLARCGYEVTGSDTSAASLRRAEVEAQRLGVRLKLIRADFRDLSRVGGPFDVVVSADNALPHMDSREQLGRALQGMAGALAPGGLLVASTRDYDAVIGGAPTTAPPTLVAGPPRRVIVRLHDWDAPDSPRHTVRFLVMTEDVDGWSVVEHAVRYRAVTRAELSELAGDAGLVDVTWHSAEATGFHQPVMTARRSDVAFR